MDGFPRNKTVFLHLLACSKVHLHAAAVACYPYICAKLALPPFCPALRVIQGILSPAKKQRLLLYLALQWILPRY